MEVKEVFLLLSEGEPSTFDDSILFETSKEKKAIATAVICGICYVFFIMFGYKVAGLVSISLSLVALLYHSVISVVREKDFILNPVKGYVEKVNERCDLEKEVSDKLSAFSDKSLVEARDILIHEQSRVDKHTLFLSGSIYKLGIFPSFLALFYAFHSYQSSPDSGVFAYALLGLIIGMYIGVLLIQRITSWQCGCIYLLSKLINERVDKE